MFLDYSSSSQPSDKAHADAAQQDSAWCRDYSWSKRILGVRERVYVDCPTLQRTTDAKRYVAVIIEIAVAGGNKEVGRY